MHNMHVSRTAHMHVAILAALADRMKLDCMTGTEGARLVRTTDREPNHDHVFKIYPTPNRSSVHE